MKGGELAISAGRRPWNVIGVSSTRPLPVSEQNDTAPKMVCVASDSRAPLRKLGKGRVHGRFVLCSRQVMVENLTT